MANQTDFWTDDSGMQAATTEPAVAGGGQEEPTFHYKMSQSEVVIFNTYIKVDCILRMVVGVLSVFSNSFILAVTSRRRPLSVPQVYIAGIAICDLFIGIFTAILMTFSLIRCRPEWARVLCVYFFWPSFGLNTGFAMSASLSAMYLSIDRLISLKFPLRYLTLSSSKNAKILIISTIITTQVICINYPLRLEVKPRIEDDYENVDVGHSSYTAIGLIPALQRVSFATEFFARFAIPLFVMLITNTWTLYCIAINNRKRKKLAANGEAPQQKKTKFLAVTVGVVIIFFLTQSVRTGFLIHSLLFFNKHRGLLITELLGHFGSLLAHFNSVVNIFIYLAFDQRFRKIFIRLMTCATPEPNVPKMPTTKEESVGSSALTDRNNIGLMSGNTTENASKARM